MDWLTHLEATSLLVTLFPFSAGMHEADKVAAVGKGIGRALDGGVVTARTLKNALRLEERAVQSRPQKNFTLASDLSFSLPMPVKPPTRYLPGDTRIVGPLPRRYALARRADAMIARLDDRPSNYTTVLTRVRARSVGEALDVAVSQLDLLRGMWNYALVSRTIWSSGSDPTTPIARIRPGRVHTLHERGGPLASHLFLLNSDVRHTETTRLSRAEWADMQRHIRWAQRGLRRVSYRADIERAFIHYARALDPTEMQVAFLKLWGVLEVLTANGGERYDRLVARAGFLFNDDEPLKDYVLEHLRYQRNEIAHLGNPPSEMRLLVFQLKRFVEQMLAFHIAMGREFASLEEAGAFLDLGEDPVQLRRQLALIRRAIRFQQRQTL